MARTIELIETNDRNWTVIDHATGIFADWLGPDEALWFLISAMLNREPPPYAAGPRSYERWHAWNLKYREIEPVAGVIEDMRVCADYAIGKVRVRRTYDEQGNVVNRFPQFARRGGTT